MNGPNVRSSQVHHEDCKPALLKERIRHEGPTVCFFPNVRRLIIWRFLDGVSTAVSSRMLRGSSPAEENLTFLLCELLDESPPGLHVLEYPLATAKTDLEKSDAGITIDV